MSKTVWKYELEPVCTLDIPKGAKILSFGAQFDKPVLWVLVDPKAETEKREFSLCGTGQPIECADDMDFIGTAMFHGHTIVLHLFERRDSVQMRDAKWRKSFEQV